MIPQELIEKTKSFVKQELAGETTGHDWWHAFLVWKNAVRIAKKESADTLVAELAALLHDIGDWKITASEDSGAQKIRTWLESLRVPEDTIRRVIEIVSLISYKGPTTRIPALSLEGKIVQDADRLEALGAIGIARAFAMGQKLGQAIYDPELKANLDQDAAEYKKQYTGEKKNSTINHFSEKLLLLKDRMNTAEGKRLAEHRHKIMEQFLDEFYKEWDGQR